MLSSLSADTWVRRGAGKMSKKGGRRAVHRPGAAESGLWTVRFDLSNCTVLTGVLTADKSHRRVCSTQVQD
jgi:hypothetical protein